MLCFVINFALLFINKLYFLLLLILVRCFSNIFILFSPPSLLMEFSEVKEQIETALGKGEFITFFCHCSISYSGRAESYLDFGDRFVGIKQDRTVFIHQPNGGMPINYVKAPAGIEIFVDESDEGEKLIFRATSGDDEVHMEVLEVFDLFSKKLKDGAKQDLSGNEAEMSDMLRNNPGMVCKDFIPLSREEHTKYGFIDVFGHLGDGTLAIVECKRYTAGLAAVTQLHRYVVKMKKEKGTKKITGYLAAPAITANAQEMMLDYKYTFAQVDPPMRHVNKKRKQKKMDSFF